MALSKDYLHIQEYTVLGKLPDPFVCKDGSRVKTVQDWERRRTEIFSDAVSLQYGTLPPAPAYFRLDRLQEQMWGGFNSYRITVGNGVKQFSFRFQLMLPAKSEKKPPVVVCGDQCFRYIASENFLSVAAKNGIAMAMFDRTELANDVQHEGKKGPLYELYPDYTFGAIGAWAWGYSRVVDALEILGYTDPDWIAFTGHSRGGKTAMLAGVADKRAAIVAPNETDAGSCACYRIHLRADAESGTNANRSETLQDMHDNFDFWFGNGMWDYLGREEELPFDCHYLKALVAPRILLIAEAAADVWGNPVGSWQTTMAAKEVFRFLGCEDKLYWYFREGLHYHRKSDFEKLVALILHRRDGTPLPEGFFETPFHEPEPIFDFRAPGNT